MDKEIVIKEYSERHQSKYHDFAKLVGELVISILEVNKIIAQSITWREKSPKSLAEKIVREGKSYNNPLDEVTDLAGVRIITYFVSDVDKILPLIQREFIVDKDKSIDKRKSTNPSIFGYASVHLIVKLSESRTKLPEYAAFKDLNCEIQLRTVLQHAWAEIEHDIIYKSSEDIPFELRRRFASLAGLLEVADREFESLKKDEVETRKKIKDIIKTDNLKIPLNMDSLRFYLEKYHNEKNLPSYRLSKLVSLLAENDIETIDALDSILTKESLNKADKSVLELVSFCRDSLLDPKKCLIRYAITVGTHFNMNLRNIGIYVDCPALIVFNEDKSAISNEVKSHKKIIKRYQDGQRKRK